MKKALLALVFGLVGFAAINLASPTKAAAVVDNTPDCDTVAIVKCGSQSLNEMRADYRANAYGDVHRVYSAFGISTNELQNDNSFKNGIVWRNGNVTVNGKIVATNAVTAGRWNNPTSDMTRIPNTTRAYKMDTRHFADEGQTAFVKFDANGNFMFAIMKSCGNPVKAEPIVPIFVCDKLTFDRQNRTKFTFTGKARANKYVEIVKYEINFGDGKSDTKQTNNKEVTFTHNYDKEGDYNVRITVTGRYSTNGNVVTKTSQDCVVKVTAKADVPEYACLKITRTRLGINSFSFKATGSASNGATIRDYTINYGDGKTEVSKTGTFTHEYAAHGSYNVVVHANAVVGDRLYPVTADTCKIKVTVTDQPIYECSALTATLLDAAISNYKYNLEYEAENGAVLNTVDFDFGDGATVTGLTASQLANVTHAYTKPGTYTTTATLKFNVGGAVQEVKCTTPVTIAACPSNPNVPLGSPECKDAPCVYNPELPKDSPECKAPETPVTLVKTGPASVAAVFALVAVIGAIAHTVFSRRRA